MKRKVLLLVSLACLACSSPTAPQYSKAELHPHILNKTTP